VTDPRLLPPDEQVPLHAEQGAHIAIPGRFLPGKSGNPNGRPRNAGRPLGSISRVDREVLRRVRENAPKYFKRMEGLSEQDTDLRVAFAATAKLVDIALREAPEDQRPAPRLPKEAFTEREQKAMARMFAKAQRRMARGKLPGAVIDVPSRSLDDVPTAGGTK
jgi:hypothetical protein